MDRSFQLEPEIIAEAENLLPNLATELVRAKNYLKTQASATGDTLYDHLSDLVSWLLQHKPLDAADTFEQYSWRIRMQKFTSNFPGALRDIYIPPKEMEAVMKINEMIETIRRVLPPEIMLEEEEPEPEPEMEEGGKAVVPDIIQNNYYFTLAGCGMIESEAYSVYLALKMLAVKEPISSVRFFGKIFGLKANYYVAETEWTDYELDRRIRIFDLEERPGEEEALPEQDKDEEGDELSATAIEQREELGEGEFAPSTIERQPPPIPDPPKNMWMPPEPVPRERPGQGVNKKVYWVCNNPGDQWILLPDVTAKQINVARVMFERCMSGDLETEVKTYPPFEGTEMHYLRAQIARIAAATSISPQGYYTTGSGEEEEDIDLEDMTDGELNLNPYYQGHTLKDLTDPKFSAWVHHQRYILPQGRTVWWNPSHPTAGEEEQEEEEAGAEPQRGPPLLSPLSEDSTFTNKTKIWTATTSAGLTPDTAVVKMRSNLWPGAYAFATQTKKSDCIYVGWGLKYQEYNYSPPLLPKVQREYTIGPEVMEITDPTFADEEAYRIAHLPPVHTFVGEGEGFGEEQGETED